VNVHAKSCLTLEPLRTLRSETKGQAAACPDRTQAIPCKVQGGFHRQEAGPQGPQSVPVKEVITFDRAD
jgi:hypothetical protein